MKTILTIAFCLAFVVFSWVLVHYKLWERITIFATQPVFGKNWKNEVDKQKYLYNEIAADLIFLGDSHMEQCEWQEVFSELKTANRGIGGESTEGLLARISVLPPGDSTKVLFLQIGINDLLGGRKPSDVLSSYKNILDEIAIRRYIVVPTLVFYVRYIPEVNPLVTEFNKLIVAELADRKIHFIDLNPIIAENETLLSLYSADGVHLSAAGYQKWIVQMKPFIRMNGQASGYLLKMNKTKE